MKQILCLLFCLMGFFSCDHAHTKNLSEEKVPTSTPSSSQQPQNVIFLIGDGMGLTQISAGMYEQGNYTALEMCKTVGLHKPYSSDKLVTDSAAAATSFACGVKTYNGAIGVDSDTIAVESVLSLAEKKNMKTGLVASSTIVHATPGAFFAHNKARKNYEEIAADMVGSGVDFFVGGGKQYFNNRSIDSRDLYQELRDEGYFISDFFDKDFERVKIPRDQKFGYLTANKDPLPIMQGRDYMINASKEAMNYLSETAGDDGFFLMIEGSQIDWGGHANEADYVLAEFKEFDKIVREAIEFAKADGNTLVIITADHETGGLAIQPDSKMNKLTYAFTSKYHTGTLIPVFAYGPGEEAFGGIYENTAIFNKIKNALGL